MVINVTATEGINIIQNNFHKLSSNSHSNRSQKRWVSQPEDKGLQHILQVVCHQVSAPENKCTHNLPLCQHHLSAGITSNPYRKFIGLHTIQYMTRLIISSSTCTAKPNNLWLKGYSSTPLNVPFLPLKALISLFPCCVIVIARAFSCSTI